MPHIEVNFSNIDENTSQSRQAPGVIKRSQYHGDFDWPGLHIGNHVIREHGAQPWRFRAEDYEVALQANSAIAAPLAGKVVDAVWDPTLTKAMQHHRVAIAEEGLATSLLVDLDDY